MAQQINKYDYKKVYFIKLHDEKVIRKMILSDERLHYISPHNFYIIRTFTVAGIGEVVKYYHFDSNRNETFVNGIKQKLGFNVYNDIDGTSKFQSVDAYDYYREQFASIHNISYDGIMFVWKWDGIVAKKCCLSISEILTKECNISLMEPTFDKDYLKERNIYLTKSDCENDNVVEVIDFSF
jgi:hypothetical protein